MIMFMLIPVPAVLSPNVFGYQLLPFWVDLIIHSEN